MERDFKDLPLSVGKIVKELVTSPDLSLKLKKLGIEKQGLYVWFYHPKSKKYIIGVDPCFDKELYNVWSYAYTASELMEILPEGVDIMKWKGYSVKSPNEWDRQLKKPNLCEALAEMLIYLIENNKMGD